MNVAARKILCRPSGDMEPIQVPEELKAAIVGIYEAIKGSVKIFDPICKTYRSEVERLQKDPRDIRLSPEGNHCTLEWHVHLAERLVRYLLTPTEAPSCYPPRGHADYKEGSALSLHDSRHPEVKAGLERTRSCAYKLVETIDTVRCQHNISSIRSSPDYWIELDRQRQAEEASTLGNYYDAHRA